MQRIIDLAEKMRDEYGGRTIFDTAENSGVIVWYRKLGGLKGFYVFENGSRYIVINDELDEIMKKAVCAHELGHDQLHRELSVGAIRDNTLFLKTNKTEREANLFAAQILLRDDVVLSELKYNNNVEAVAYELGVPVELLEYKLEILAYQGHDVHFTDVDNSFLKYERK